MAKKYKIGSGSANKDRPAWHPPREIGLARALQKAGYGSRRQVEALLQAGRIKVDGQVCREGGGKVVPASVIELDGQQLVAVLHRYYVFNKPLRVLAYPEPIEGKRTIREFFPPGIHGLNAAGRLDSKTSGLLLISNDPDWNNLVAASTQLDHEYRLQIAGELGELEIGLIASGINVPKVGLFKPQSVKIVEIMQGRTVLTMVVRAGKIRHLRRMLGTLRHQIDMVRRIRIGEIRLGDLAVGKVRAMTEVEIESIRRVFTENPPGPA